MPAKQTIVFLYTELAGYIYACIERLAESGADVHVFAYPVNEEAPFKLDLERSAAKYYRRDEYTRGGLKEAVSAIQPDMVVCSGWIDQDYLAVVKSLPPHVKKTLALDNQLPTSAKGWLSLFRARAFYRKHFDLAWVPGSPQVAYAQKIGFVQSAIFTGFYAADIQKFQKAFSPSEEDPFPKRFVFVGRYLEFKGIKDLWDAYDSSELPGWELWCAGQGPLFSERRKSEGIHHIGFVQPDEMDTFVSLGGVFVLPSHREPWGVVVHEFAAAGYPLICSNAVGAAAAFLKEGLNGFSTEPGNVESLAAAMKKIANLDDQALKRMSAESAALAKTCTPDIWVQTVAEILETK